MKKILLINSNRLRHPWPVIPFGLCSVAAALEVAGYSVNVLDLCFSSQPERDIQRAIQTEQPDIIGIGIRNIDNASGYNTIFMLDQIKCEVVEPCKKYSACPIVIGGAAVGISGAEMLQFFDLPYAIQGDGERAIVELVKRLENNAPMDGLGGLIQRSNDGRILEDNPPWPVQDLNALPYVSFKRYIDADLYNQYNSPLQIQTKRGCALRCAYCTYNRIEGAVYRLRDPQRVADEIERMVSETGIDFIEFTDSTFNIPLAHAKAVLCAVASRKLNLKCRAMGLNPSAVDEELAGLMSQGGFKEVDLGVESGCDLTLQGLVKNFTKKDVMRAGSLLQAKKIPTSWYLLVGAPGETVETLNETFETIANAASPWDLVIIGVGIRVYKGSPISECFADQDPDSRSDNFLHPVSYEPEALDLEAIKVLTKRAILRYSNFLSYDEDIQFKDVVIRGANLVLKWFANDQPLWRMLILYRKVQNFIGVGFIRRKKFDRTHEKLIARVQAGNNFKRVDHSIKS